MTLQGLYLEFSWVTQNRHKSWSPLGSVYNQNLVVHSSHQLGLQGMTDWQPAKHLQLQRTSRDTESPWKPVLLDTHGKLLSNPIEVATRNGKLSLSDSINSGYMLVCYEDFTAVKWNAKQPCQSIPSCQWNWPAPPKRQTPEVALVAHA